MPTSYTPPTESYGWPTGSLLIDRLSIPRGLTVITDGHGGWYTDAFPYLGDIENLTEGVDYFMGGHVYEIDCTTALSLYNAGFFPGYPQSTCAAGGDSFPSSLTYPSTTTYP
jgi:hypothetical protein